MGGKKVLLIDSDMRRSCQRDIFRYSKKAAGLSNVLIGECEWQKAIRHTEWETLDVMPAGQLPPNPAELLGSGQTVEDAAEGKLKYTHRDL